jgi:hypothetical protein
VNIVMSAILALNTTQHHTFDRRKWQCPQF